MLKYKDGSIKDTLAAFFLMLVCIEMLGIANGIVLVMNGASSSVPKYIGREVFVSLLLVIPVLVPGLAGRIYAVMLYICAAILTSCNVVHEYLYNTPATSYVFIIASETYTAEISDFIAQFVDINVVIRVMAVMLLPLPALLLSFRYRRRSFLVAFLLVVMAGGLFAMKSTQSDREATTVIRWNYMADTVWSCVKAYTERAQFTTQMLKSPELPAGLRTDATNRVLVLAIGESANRHHYSLYGYPRPTTPKLDAMREELLVFTDVISPHAHTVAALQKALTFANHEGDEARCSVVDVLKGAGYHVVVLTNQPWLGQHETTTSRMLAGADEVQQFNTSNAYGYYEAVSLDEVMLPSFKTALQRDGNVAIIVHLMGSHATYNRRYPSSMETFSDKPPSAVIHPLTDKRIEELNEYDNSLFYTDTMLSQMISMLDVSNRPAAFVYFSDHGEAMYEDGSTRGHAENVASRYMFDIPLVVWCSDEYKRERTGFFEAAKKNVHFKWQADDLIYPVLNLAGITFDTFKNTKDILSPSWVFEKRPMGNADYDQLFRE